MITLVIERHRDHGVGGTTDRLGEFLEAQFVAAHDRYRRLFGEVALEQGVVNSDQLYQALTVQERLRNEGKQVPLLGQVLVELGHLTPEQLQELIEYIYPVQDNEERDEGSSMGQEMAGSEES